MTAKDEEEMAEAGEVEKRRMHQCSECGKSYKHEHKLKHHKTGLCKERALGQVQSEPRRELSSNFFHLPTIPEGEEVFASERGVRDNFGGFLLFLARGFEMSANKASLGSISLHHHSLSNIDR